MNDKMELTLRLLECCWRYSDTLSAKELSIKAQVSEAETKCMLSTLQKRGYLKKANDTQGYVLTEKIMILV